MSNKINILGSSNYGSTTSSQDELKLGIYHHFKGGEYEVFCVATHREKKEKLVVYQGLNNDHLIEWKPLSEFTEVISRGDYTGPRYTYVRESDRNKE